MASIIARAITMLAFALQSFFDWSPENETSRMTRMACQNDQESDALGSCDSNNNPIHIAGLVLARGGSKGIPKKNLAEVGGRPLVGRALQAMVNSQAFTRIWVSTDDPEISSWVTKHFPKTASIHNRAAYTATDNASSMIAVQEFLSFHPEIDAIGLVQATSPFISPEYLRKASNLLQNYESVFSATRSHHLRWSSIVKPTHNKNSEITKPLNFNRKTRPRRQDWDGEMVENGMFYFAFRDVIMKQDVFQSERGTYIEIPKHLSLEVDTPEDLLVAQCLASVFESSKNGDRNQELHVQNG